MKTKPQPKRKFVVATFSAEEALIKAARDHSRAKDTDLSKYVRSLIRKDLREAGLEVAAA